MDRFQRYGNLLKNDGTNQLQRLSPALEPDYILPDERSLSDLLAYAHKLAAQIRFYSLTGQSTGNWQPFLERLIAEATTGGVYNTTTLENLLSSRRDWPPHLALFIVFLKLFQALQSDLNELPQRHLRHYYEQELNLLRRDAQADAVHVIFELARNAAPTLIPAGTLLDAGKDAEGRPLYYAIESDLVVNGAKISDIRRLVGETDRRGFRRFFTTDTISELEGNSWYTFGRQQLDLDPSQRFMTEAQMGFAITSPILLMAEGRREVTIEAQLQTVSSQQPITQGLDRAFIVELTGAEGWLTTETVKAKLINNSLDQSLTLEMTLTLAETAPAVVVFDPALHGDGPATSWPMVRCRLNNASGYYDTLDGLVIESVRLLVSVQGVKNLVVQNSQRLLTPDQPMQIFGNQPHLGSSFYIGSAEVFSKRLTSLDLHLTWHNLPEDLFDYYSGYFDSVSGNVETSFSNYFIASIDLLYNNSWNHTLKPSAFLFDYFNPTREDIAIRAADFDVALRDVQYSPRPELVSLQSYKTNTQYGFIRLVLQGARRGEIAPSFEAFGHQMFPIRYATQAIALSRWQDGSNLPEPRLPKEPITPTLDSLSLDYSALVNFTPGNIHAEDKVFQLTPFGYADSSITEPARLVPSITETVSIGESMPNAESEFAMGILYIGLTGLTPPANISLLFQIDRGTAETTEILKSNQTEWSYLSGNTWTMLPRTAIFSDSTYGFQEPGLVVLSIGRNASLSHTIMPPGKVWLRALIRQVSVSAARTLNLSSQALRATFSPTVEELSDYNDHLRLGLAAETIQQLKRRAAAIKVIHQPYASFGGRAIESDIDFFQRCSERLRHRNRAVTSWDFERLVLEAFPEVFKVKCLSHSNAEGQHKAGEIALVVIPNVRSLPSLQPRAGAVLLNRIQDYVDSNISTFFAKIHVIHPLYELIRVDARVAFRSGLDAGYYAVELNQDLQRFLSPWAYEEGEDIVFGGQIYRSEILAFMEGRDYVDYITDFSLYHSYAGSQTGGINEMTIGLDFLLRPDPYPLISTTEDGMKIGDTFVVGRGVEAAIATQPQSILVSHADHRIIPISGGPTRCEGVETLGIGYMTVRLDFDIAKTI